MKIDLSLQKYVDWEVKPVMPLKGKFAYRVILTYMDGTQRPQQKGGFKTEKEANAARERTIGELYSGSYIVYSNVYVGEYMDFWLREDILKRIKSNETYAGFKSAVKNHILPTLGKKKMSAVTRGDVQKLYNEKAAYSASVARTVKTVMNISMRFALDKKIISENPAKDVKLPKYIKKKTSGTRNIDSKKTLNVEQIMVLLEASRDTPIHMQVLLNVLMGLRRQEINGVKYSDIDYINRTLNLERQLGQKINTQKEDFEPKTFTKQEVKLKTFSSQRVLPIPDYVFEAILEQREIYEENRRKRKNFRDLDYICCSKDGMPRSKSYHWKLYKQLLKDNNLPDIRWHDLRSTFCTLLLKNDFSPKAVSKLMGHAKEIITIDVYADKKMIIADCIDELQPYIDDVLPDDEEIDTMDVACQVDVTEYLEQVVAPALEGWMATGELLAI